MNKLIILILVVVSCNTTKTKQFHSAQTGPYIPCGTYFDIKITKYQFNKNYLVLEGKVKLCANCDNLSDVSIEKTDTINYEEQSLNKEDLLYITKKDGRFKLKIEKCRTAFLIFRHKNRFYEPQFYKIDELIKKLE